MDKKPKNLGGFSLIPADASLGDFNIQLKKGGKWDGVDFLYDGSEIDLLRNVVNSQIDSMNWIPNDQCNIYDRRSDFLPKFVNSPKENDFSGRDFTQDSFDDLMDSEDWESLDKKCFRNCRFVGVDFTEKCSELSGVDFYDCAFLNSKLPALDSCNFVGGRMSEVVFEGGKIENCGFYDLACIEMDFRGVSEIYCVDMLGCELIDPNFDQVKLDTVNFGLAGKSVEENTSMTAPHFRGSRLFNCGFQNSCLDSPDFSTAVLEDVDYSDAVLVRADFEEAMAVRTVFRGTKMKEANLRNFNRRRRYRKNNLNENFADRYDNGALCLEHAEMIKPIGLELKEMLEDDVFLGDDSGLGLMYGEFRKKFRLMRAKRMYNQIVEMLSTFEYRTEIGHRSQRTSDFPGMDNSRTVRLWGKYSWTNFSLSVVSKKLKKLVEFLENQKNIFPEYCEDLRQPLANDLKQWLERYEAECLKAESAIKETHYLNELAGEMHFHSIRGTYMAYADLTCTSGMRSDPKNSRMETLVYGADFRGADLEGSNGTGAHFYGAIFGGTNCENVDFRGANLSGCDLYSDKRSSYDEVTTETSFRGAKLNGAGFFMTRVGGGNFREADFSSGGLITGVSPLYFKSLLEFKYRGGDALTDELSKDDIRLGRLLFNSRNPNRRSTLPVIEEELPRCLSLLNIRHHGDLNVMSGLDRQRGNVTLPYQIIVPTFEKADLVGANLGGCNLAGNDFSGAKLSRDGHGASLAGTNLQGCRFAGDLSACDFAGAYLKGADFSGCTVDDLGMVCFDGKHNSKSLNRLLSERSSLNAGRLAVAEDAHSGRLSPVGPDSVGGVSISRDGPIDGSDVDGVEVSAFI